MTNSILEQQEKRRLLRLMAMLPWIGGCSAAGRQVDATNGVQARFNGIGVVLVVDAVVGAEMNGVVFYDDRGWTVYAKSLVSRRTREILGLGGTRVPLTVRAVWGKDRRFDYSNANWYGGTILSDHTISVADRIPGEVLNDIRGRRGALRLKFRLKPDGVLFGRDIQRKAPLGDVSIFDMPGGDFLETRY